MAFNIQMNNHEIYTDLRQFSYLLLLCLCSGLLLSLCCFLLDLTWKISIHRYAHLLESTCVIDAGFETVAFENHPETMNIELVVSSYERISYDLVRVF